MPEQDANEVTLQTYREKTQKYIENTPAKINDAEYVWIDQALDLTPREGKVLEIGGGAGRNAEYIVGRGYSLECTEAIPEFIEIMQQKGLNARLLNILKDDIDGLYDMVLANGVLVHFTPEQTNAVFDKVYRALKKNGIFAFSVKMGNGEKWTSEKLDAPRYFYFWQPEALKEVTEKHGFEWLGIVSGHTSLRNAQWLYCIARRVL